MPSRAPDRERFRRIMVLNRSHIGDCLLTTPALRALRRGFPDAHLAVSVPENNRDLLARNPHLDEIFLRPQRTHWLAKLRFARDLRRWRPDLVISFQEKSLFYGWACRFQRRPVTLCMDHPRTRRFYERTVPLPRDSHEVEKYLAVTDALGCPRAERPALELVVPDAARAAAARLLEELGAAPDERFLGVTPGGIKPEKRWPVERFAEATERLQEALGLRALIVGGPSDVEPARRIAERCSRRPLVVAGRTALGETAACLERCRVFVTNDTGPMHMAAALALPVVGLFGPTSPVKFGPFTALGTVLRHEEPCPECRTPCMHTLEVEEVVAAALRLTGESVGVGDRSGAAEPGQQ